MFDISFSEGMFKFFFGRKVNNKFLKIGNKLAKKYLNGPT